MYQDKIDNYLSKNGFGAFCPKAVLFDMDGVLYDSMPNHARSWRESMAEFGIDMPEAEAYKYEGMRGVETIKLKVREQLHREISDGEAQRMYAEKSRLFSLCPQAKIMDGVVELRNNARSPAVLVGQDALVDCRAGPLQGLRMRQRDRRERHGHVQPRLRKSLTKALRKAGLCRTGLQNGPFGTAKRTVRHRKTGCSAMQDGPFCNVLRFSMLRGIMRFMNLFYRNWAPTRYRHHRKMSNFASWK